MKGCICCYNYLHPFIGIKITSKRDDWGIAGIMMMVFNETFSRQAELQLFAPFLEVMIFFCSH